MCSEFTEKKFEKLLIAKFGKDDSNIFDTEVHKLVTVGYMWVMNGL